MTELHRVQLLIEIEQREALAEIAAREGRSMSEVARELIDLGLEQRRQKQEGWRDALARLNAIRERQRETNVDVASLLASVREERMDELERRWRGEL